MSEPNLVVLDIETSPNVADVWGLFNQNIGISQLRESTMMIGFAAKTVGKPKIEWRSEFHDGRETMVQRAWDILSEADAVIHFNGTSFDMPHLRREFLLAGLSPHKPVQEIDLCRVVKKRFRFTSNKLQYVSTQLGLEGKQQHEGHGLWVKCMNGDTKAWSQMRSYCKQDVALTEKLYHVLRPWVPAHPHMGLFSSEDCCARCGSTELERRGYAYTNLAAFQQFRCRDCGSWSRSGKSVERVDARGTA